MQAFYHLRSAHSQPENETTLGNGVQALRGHGRHGRHPGADLQDAGAQFDVFGFGRQVGQGHDRVHTPGLGGPGLIHAHPVRGHGVVDELVPVLAVVIGGADGN